MDSKKLEELIEVRDKEYDRLTQLIFDEIPHVIHGIRKYLGTQGVKQSSVRFEALDIISNVVFISFFCEGQDVGSLHLENSITVKLPGEMVMDGSADTIFEFLKQSDIVHVDDEGNIIDEQPTTQQKNTRTIH